MKNRNLEGFCEFIASSRCFDIIVCDIVKWEDFFVVIPIEKFSRWWKLEFLRSWQSSVIIKMFERLLEMYLHKKF